MLSPLSACYVVIRHRFPRVHPAANMQRYCERGGGYRNRLQDSDQPRLGVRHCGCDKPTNGDVVIGIYESGWQRDRYGQQITTHIHQNRSSVSPLVPPSLAVGFP